MFEASPGVWRRPRSEIEEDINNKACGMRWEEAQGERKRLFRLRIAVLELFVEAGQKRR